MRRVERPVGFLITYLLAQIKCQWDFLLLLTVLLSATQQSDPVTHIDTYFYILFLIVYYYYHFGCAGSSRLGEGFL